MNYNFDPFQVSCDKAVRFFALHGFSVRVIGKKENPAFIANESVCLSCTLKNNVLIFNEAPNSGVVFKHDLNSKNQTDVYSDVQDWYENCKHRQIWKIRIKDAFLFLCGYNFLKNVVDEEVLQYPVFAEHQPKIYFKKEDAQEIVDKFNTKFLQLEIV